MAFVDMREPGVYVSIEDRSYTEPSVESGRSVYSVILCDRGPSDQIVKITSQKQFHNVFGTPNYLKTSQTHYALDAALKYSSAVYATRVVPDDAARANVYIKENAATSVTEDMLIHGDFKFKPGLNTVEVKPSSSVSTSASEIAKLTIGDWIFFGGYSQEEAPDSGISKACQIINIETKTGTTYITLDRKYDEETIDTSELTGNAYRYVPYEIASMTDVTDVNSFTNTSGDVLYYFYANGAGKYYNRLYIAGTRNTDLERAFVYDDGTPMYKYMFMDIAVYEMQDNDTPKMVEGPWTVSLIPNYPNDQNRMVRNPITGEYLYIEDVINDNSNLIRCVSTQKNESGDINTPFPSVDKITKSEDSEDRRLQVMLLLSTYTPVGTNSVVSSTPKCRLAYGSDGTGQYNAAGNIDPNDELLGKVGRAFNGTLTVNGIDQIREQLYPVYSPDYIVCGGYPAYVQDNAVELASYRQDCICIADTGGYKNSYDKDITARKDDVSWNNWNTMIYTQYRRIFDEYTGRYFWVSPTYHAIQRHLYVDGMYFISEPVAGIEKGDFGESVTLAYTANHTERGDLGDVELNVTIDESDGKYFLTQYTAYKRYSALKRGHIAKFTSYLKKTIPGLLKDILQQKGTAFWISQANIRVNTFLSKFLEGSTERYSILRNFTSNVSFSDSTSQLDVYITITPIRAIEKIQVVIGVA